MTDEYFERRRAFWADVLDNAPVTDAMVPYLETDDGKIYLDNAPSITISREQYIDMYNTAVGFEAMANSVVTPESEQQFNEHHIEYWEGSDIHDLTYDEMVAEVESYIAFCKHVRDAYPEFETDGVARMGLARRGDSDRWELVCFNPDLDSIYTTTDVVDKIVAAYPDVFSEKGRAP